MGEKELELGEKELEKNKKRTLSSLESNKDTLNRFLNLCDNFIQNYMLYYDLVSYEDLFKDPHYEAINEQLNKYGVSTNLREVKDALDKRLEEEKKKDSLNTKKD